MKSLAQELTALQQAGLYRRVNSYKVLDATHVADEKQQYLVLASNNYLGLTHYPKVVRMAQDALKEYGTGSGGARLTTGSTDHHEALEQELAGFKGTEAALVFNTGYMANIGTITALVGKQDVVFSDELNHASIVDGCRLAKGRTVIYKHSDVGDLAERLKNTACEGRRLIVTDGVFSMDGDIAPLPQIVEVAEKYDAIVMVDDAHAVGVIGQAGRGTVSHFGLEGRVQIQIGTLSKSLGAEGGYVAGSKELVIYLMNKARSFIFSTALAPATIAAARGALSVLVDNPSLVDKLQANTSYLRDMLTGAGFNLVKGNTPILPIIIGDAGLTTLMAEELKHQGLIISAIRPPTVPFGSSRLRITLSAAHDKAELIAAAKKIIAVGKKLKVLEG